MEEEQQKHRAEMEALHARLQQAQGQRNRLLRAFEGLQGWWNCWHAHQGCSRATWDTWPQWCCHQAAAPACDRLQLEPPLSCSAVRMRGWRLAAETTVHFRDDLRWPYRGCQCCFCCLGQREPVMTSCLMSEGQAMQGLLGKAG